MAFIRRDNIKKQNEKMREELALSESTIVKAKKVLSGELWAIMTDKIVEKQGDGQYKCMGTWISATAWITPRKEKV